MRASPAAAAAPRICWVGLIVCLRWSAWVRRRAPVARSRTNLRAPGGARGKGCQWVRILLRKSWARALCGCGEERLRAALLDDLPVGHEDDAVGGLAGEAHLVGDDDHGHPALGQADHHVEDLVDHLRVEGRGRLVEEDDLGVHGQRPGDGDPLLLPARELRGVLVGLGLDADPRRAAPGRARGPAAAESLRTLTGPRVTFSSTVLCAKRLKDWKTIPTSARSWASARPSSGIRCPSIVIVPEPIVSSRLITRHSVDLPEPGRPEHDDHLALGDRQVDVLQHVQVAEVLVDVLEHDQRRAGAWGLHRSETSGRPALGDNPGAGSEPELHRNCYRAGGA